MEVDPASPPDGPPAVTSTTRDRIALAVALLYGAVALLWVALSAVTGHLGTWRGAAFAAGLVLVFGLQCAGWWRASQSLVVVDHDGVARPGPSPVSWQVAASAVADASVVMVRGRPYLVVVPRVPTTRWHASRLLVARVVPRGAVTAPLDPARVAEMRDALAR